MAESGKSGPHELIQEGEQALLNEEWASAQTAFKAALEKLEQEKEPPAAHLAEAFNGLGAALLQLGRFTEAVLVLRQAIEKQPSHAGAFFNSGLAYEALGDSRQALEAYSRAIELQPDDAEFYFRRGGVYFAAEEFERTIEDVSKAVDLHPEGEITGPFIARGLAYFRLEQYERALSDFNRALAGDPRASSEAYFYRALVYINLNDALSARADLQAFLIMTDDLDGSMAGQAREIIEELDKIE